MSNNLNDHSIRDHALLSASSAHRWLACPPSAVAADMYQEETSEYAAEGTVAHEVAEQIARARLEGKPHTVKPDPEQGVNAEMIECGEAYADYIMEKITDPNAVVLLEQKLDFSNWVPGGFGTGDCCIVQGKRVTTIDYKYGEGVRVNASGNPQMGLYALGALDLFDGLYEIEEVEKAIFQPRMDNISEEVECVVDLLDWASNTVKPIAVKAAQGKGKHTPGEHCRFCPHAGRCRALAKLCTDTAKRLDGKKVKVECLAPFEITEILELEPLLTMAIKKIKAYAMDTLLSGGEVPGYKVVEGKQGNRQWISELMACKAFEEAGYSKDDITETKLLSPAQMEKALGKKKIAEIMEANTQRAPGNPALARDTDPRPAYNRLEAAIADFD